MSEDNKRRKEENQKPEEPRRKALRLPEEREKRPDGNTRGVGPGSRPKK